MKLIYTGNRNSSLTQNKRYLAIEIYHNIDRKMTSFRIIDDFGVPSIHESRHFEFNYLKLDGMVLMQKGNNSVVTLKDLYKIVGENNNLNNLWEKYFNSENEIVELVNSKIIAYARRNGMVIIQPSPYGI